MTLICTIYSFSYRENPLYDDKFLAKLGDRKEAFLKHGGGYAFDCRFLDNPGLLPELKNFTGHDQEIISYLNQLDDIEAFKEHVLGIARMTIRSYLRKGYDTLFLGCGCTGGRHRSVYTANFLAENLMEKGDSVYEVRLMHTNI